mgnify:CR=1 FL=1
MRIPVQVSIPIGFSHQLRPALGLAGGRSSGVSIPIGFSHQLRHAGQQPRHGAPLGFNPYRVFSSAETDEARQYYEDLSEVSIPIGFSHQLRRSSLPGDTRRLPVSIPIGFSHQLRRKRARMGTGRGPWFQSLSGFLIS